jgi:AcrR family transcriptional regulator
MTTLSSEPTRGDGSTAFNFARPNASDQERVAILNAAAAAFFDFGFNDTSVDEIADRLGASKGQVYHYYRSKSDILFDIQQTTTEMYLNAITPIATSERSCDERLWLMAREHALLVVRSVAFARVTLFATSVHNYRTDQQRKAHSAISIRRREYENFFVTALSEGVSNGTFRDLDPGLASKALLGSLNWVAYWYTPGTDTPETQEAIAVKMADYVVAGVGTDSDRLQALRKQIATPAS